MPTIQELVDDILVRYPHTFTATQVIKWMNRVIKVNYKYAPQKVEKLVALTSGISSYCTAAADGFKFENLEWVQFYNTTQATLASSDLPDYTLYKKSGLNEAKGETYLFDSSGYLGIAPPPTTTGYKIVVRYTKYPPTYSTDTLTTTPAIDEDYQDLIVFGTIQIIAKAGISPDIDIANNAQADFDEILAKARLNTAKIKYKNQNYDRISYRESWTPGFDILTT